MAKKKKVKYTVGKNAVIYKKGKKGAVKTSTALKSKVLRKQLKKENKELQELVSDRDETEKALKKLTKKTRKSTFLKMIAKLDLEGAEEVRNEYERLNSP